MNTAKVTLLLAILLASFTTAHAAPSPGTKTDRLIVVPQLSAPGCPSGNTCIYARSTDGLLWDQDVSGLVLRSHDAKAFRTSSNCSALASPANGDVCFDSSIPAFRFYSAGWTSATIDDQQVVHKTGTESIAGNKTFVSSVTLTGGASLGANLVGGGFRGTGFSVGTASGQLLTADRQVLTSAPLTGGGALTADRTLGLNVSAPLAVGGGSLILSPGGVVHAHVTGGSGPPIGAGTSYLLAPGANSVALEVPLAIATRAGNLGRLYCIASTAPGGADTVVFNARIAGADSTLTCTITGAGTSCSDTTNTPAVTAGQKLAIKAVSSGSLVAGISCSFEETN